jgi:surface polysaccharide O-acyltransferase-like enzyme
MVIQVHAGEFFYIGEASAGEFLYIGEANAFLGGNDAFWVNLYNSLCRTAVPLFVMITGYFILPVKEELGIFLKKRFTRVLIPFVVWCALYAFYQYFRGQVELGMAFLNILKIPVNFGTEIGHLWYVYMLIGLYLFFPIISPWLNMASKKHLQLYLLLWSVSLCLPYIHQIYPEVLGEAYWNHTPSLYYFSGFLGYAILAFYIKKFHAEKKKEHLPIGSLLVVAGYIITYLVFASQAITSQKLWDVELSWGFETINVGMMSLGLFLLVKNIQRSSSTVFNNLITSISNLSYGMYLLHIMILNIFYSLFNELIGSVTIKIPLIAICCFISSYLVTKILSYLPKNKYLIG